jgi:transposase
VEEYKSEHPVGYNSYFCHHLNKYLKKNEATMHFEHKAGDKMFFDFTGKKLHITDRNTGEISDAEVFVAILGASQMTYVEAVVSQRKADFIGAVENALHYFEGSPRAIVPDNLKSAVIRSCSYEPELNEDFQNFALHYNTAILPARSRKPRDKALVEGAVIIVYRRIFAELRNRTFFSIDDLNEAIWEELNKHNRTNFQGRCHSRHDRFKTIEQTELTALPKERYELKDYAHLTVY